MISGTFVASRKCQLFAKTSISRERDNGRQIVDVQHKLDEFGQRCSKLSDDVDDVAGVLRVVVLVPAHAQLKSITALEEKSLLVKDLFRNCRNSGVDVVAAVVVAASAVVVVRAVVCVTVSRFVSGQVGGQMIAPVVFD